MSGGLHGVGAAVVNALSSELIAQVKRDGQRYEIRFERGEVKAKLKKRWKPARGTGTLVTFHPDDDVFGGKLHFDSKQIAERLEAKSYLHGGLEIIFTDETQSPPVTTTFSAPAGQSPSTCRRSSAERNKLAVPPGGAVFYMEKQDAEMNSARHRARRSSGPSRPRMRSAPT